MEARAPTHRTTTQLRGRHRGLGLFHQHWGCWWGQGPYNPNPNPRDLAILTLTPGTLQSCTAATSKAVGSVRAGLGEEREGDET